MNFVFKASLHLEALRQLISISITKNCNKISLQLIKYPSCGLKFLPLTVTLKLLAIWPLVWFYGSCLLYLLLLTHYVAPAEQNAHVCA